MGHMSAPESTTEAGEVRSRRTHASARYLLSSEARSSAEGRVVGLDPSWMARGDLEPLGMWRHQSPPRQRGGIQSLGHVVVPEPSLGREVGSGTMVARGSVWMHALPFVLV
jgi:hypothetical protein